MNNNKKTTKFLPQVYVDHAKKNNYLYTFWNAALALQHFKSYNPFGPNHYTFGLLAQKVFEV